MTLLKWTRGPLLGAAAMTALLLATAAPAQALYIATPLFLTASTHQADVGDEVAFEVGEGDDPNATLDWAGRTVRVEYIATFATEGEEWRTARGVILEALTLDHQAAASFTWTIPAKVDDADIRIELYDGNETAAGTNIAVGDAPPIIMAASGPADGNAGDGSEDLGDDPGAGGAPGTQGDESGPHGEAGSAPAPGVGPVALALAVAGLAAVLAWRRRA